jgi:hypothetical protein
MPGKTGQQIQIYVVIVLAVVFVILGYFQLFHEKADVEAKSITPVESDPELDLNSIQTTIKSRLHADAAPSFEPFQPIARDVFTSLKSLKKEKVSKRQTEKPKPLPPLRLKGTIVEGDRAIAIVNDQYLRIGDLIHGFKVVRISKNGVLLDSGRRQLALEMLKNE